MIVPIIADPIKVALRIYMDYVDVAVSYDYGSLSVTVSEAVMCDSPFTPHPPSVKEVSDRLTKVAADLIRIHKGAT